MIVHSDEDDRKYLNMAIHGIIIQTLEKELYLSIYSDQNAAAIRQTGQSGDVVVVDRRGGSAFTSGGRRCQASPSTNRDVPSTIVDGNRRSWDH